MNRILMMLENCGYPEDTRVRHEAESLVAAGYRVTVVAPNEGGRPIHDRVNGVAVYRYPRPLEFGGLLGYVCEYGYSIVMQAVLVTYVCVRHGADAIHLHAPPDMNAIIPAFFRLFGKKYVYDMHDLSPELYLAISGERPSRVLHRLLGAFERFAIKRADRMIATNETQKQKLIDRGGADPAHCYVVRNGPGKLFVKDAAPPSERDAAGPAVIGFVGMMGFQDGLDYLVRALRELKDRGREDFEAVLVGDGPACDSIRQLAKELGVDDRVRFTGMVEPNEVPGLIAGFDICTTPDPSNAYNDSCTTIKMMEYMALGKPTVCFDTPENKQTAADSAVYAADNDPADFAAKLELLMDSPDLRSQMGQSGRRRVEDGLTWRHQEQHLVRLYRGLLGLPEPAPSAPPLAQMNHASPETHP